MMNKLLIIFAIVSLASAAIPDDKITTLPGWRGAIPSMYSGYLPTGKTSGTPGFIHYWFIESQNDPKNDPVVYWTNGGPGGSGIAAGLLMEQGRVHLSDASYQKNSSELRLFDNPFAWSKVASVVYVSQPKGVGFSYCDIPSDQDCINNDLTSAQDFYDFIINFFDAFDEYKENDFYLTAESYGGIYIPMFMDQIDKKGGVNLKGAAIGDGCWGTQVGTCAFQTGKSQEIAVEFAQGHGMYDQVLYGEIKKACGNFSDEAVKNAECEKLLAEMNKKMGTFDIYNIYDTCGQDSTMSYFDMKEKMSAQIVEVTDETSSAKHPQLTTKKSKKEHDSSNTDLSGALNDYACGGGNAAGKWLGQDDVAAALHVKTGTKGMKYNWGPYKVSGDLRPLYKELAQKYRMLIYSGDVDACVPYWGTEEWTRELGFKVKTDWHPWMAEHLNRPGMLRAGYAIEYDTPAQFQFITVQGAGHLVPTFKPHFALTMITKFLKDEPF